MRDLGFRYVGIDVDRDGVNSANAHGISAQELPAERAAELGDRFDLVISLDVLEHVQSPLDAFKAIANVSQGVAIICVPNPDGLMARLRSFDTIQWLAMKALGNSRHIVRSLDGHWHNIAYSRRTLELLCEQADLDVILLRSMSINDPTFGIVEPNTSLSYRVIDILSMAFGMGPELLLVAKPKSLALGCEALRPLGKINQQ